MTNNNDWKEVYKKKFGLCDGSLKNCQCKEEIRFIEKNFIPLSSLKKFIEENEKDTICFQNNPPGMHYECDCSEKESFNSALKLLKDKFIHE